MNRLLNTDERKRMMVYENIAVQEIQGMKHKITNGKATDRLITVTRNNYSCIYLPFEPACLAVIFSLQETLFSRLAFFPAIAQNGVPFVDDIGPSNETFSSKNVMTPNNIVSLMENAPYNKELSYTEVSQKDKKYIKAILKGWDEYFGLKYIKYVRAQPLLLEITPNGSRLAETSPEKRVFGINVGGFLSPHFVGTNFPVLEVGDEIVLKYGEILSVFQSAMFHVILIFLRSAVAFRSKMAFFCQTQIYRRM